MAKKFLITGGGGFIGSNYVHRLLQRGEDVIVFDNLSRAGAKINLAWLQKEFGRQSFHLIVGDIRDADAICKAAKEVDAIVHLAAQVAVTTSVTAPREDFDINALGTFNVLEAARLSGRHPAVIYASTNKVYGGMENVKVSEKDNRYCYQDYPLGISEYYPLDFHSPYGCSKGCGDQYVRDYYRIYDLPTVVFRQSCIYGTRQFGIEDQGWVAWFIIAALTGKQINIYGDGKQVRDVLFVDDLLNAYDAALMYLDRTAGRVYNIGGGAEKVMAIWGDFGTMLEKLLGRTIKVTWGDWRPGDQRIYVSDIRKATLELGWSPVITPEQGVKVLFEWVKTNPELF
jgi:CDP-paratose 2-epimerase